MVIGKPSKGELRRTLRANTGLTGNDELLEAASSRSEVLPSRRRQNCKTSAKLHDWILGVP
ncbi:hypothetical protein ACMFMF_002946 [Clarireedia jacksonii]